MRLRIYASINITTNETSTDLMHHMCSYGLIDFDSPTRKYIHQKLQYDNWQTALLTVHPSILFVKKSNRLHIVLLNGREFIRFTQSFCLPSIPCGFGVVGRSVGLSDGSVVCEFCLSYVSTCMRCVHTINPIWSQMSKTHCSYLRRN